MGEHILVTGASGYVGRRLVPALLADGWNVSTLIHQSGLPDDLKSAVREIPGDLATLEAASGQIPPVSAVCHLAAVLPKGGESRDAARRCWEVNALASWKLGEMALNWPGCRFVYLSTGNFYSEGKAPASEDTSIYPTQTAVSYFTSKLAAELYLRRLQTVHALRLVCLRPTSIYGPGMTPTSVIPRFIQVARRGGELEIWDGGQAVYDWVHVEDVVRIIRCALGSDQFGTYNVGSGVSHSVLECAGLVREIFAPDGATIRVLPATTASRGFRPVSIARAAAAFGYQPLTLREGLTAIARALED